MGILDDYKQLQMIENIKKIKEMELCYKSNLKLCKQQEKQINKLATAIEKIKEMCSSVENIENANTLYESKLSGIYLQARKILQICDEVNDER